MCGWESHTNNPKGKREKAMSALGFSMTDPLNTKESLPVTVMLFELFNELKELEVEEAQLIWRPGHGSLNYSHLKFNSISFGAAEERLRKAHAIRDGYTLPTNLGDDYPAIVQISYSNGGWIKINPVSRTLEEPTEPTVEIVSTPVVASVRQTARIPESRSFGKRVDFGILFKNVPLIMGPFEEPAQVAPILADIKKHYGVDIANEDIGAVKNTGSTKNSYQLTLTASPNSPRYCGEFTVKILK